MVISDEIISTAVLLICNHLITMWVGDLTAHIRNLLQRANRFQTGVKSLVGRCFQFYLVGFNLFNDFEKE